MGRLYSTLVAAPSKILGGVSTLVGLAAAIRPQWVETEIGSHVNAATIQNLGIALLAASALYFCLLWLLKPSKGDGHNAPNVAASGHQAVAIGSVHGGFHQHQAPPKFSKIIEFKMLPEFLGGISKADLDGVATLRIKGPYSEQTATLALDLIPVKHPDQIQPDVEIRDIYIHTGPTKEYFFDTQHSKRQALDVGGKVFIVTLREIEILEVPGVAKPLRFEFMVKEA